MSKLYFRYSAMNAGKTLDLIRVYKNYEERGRQVLAIKPTRDTRDKDITSRAGVSIPTTRIPETMDIYNHILEMALQMPCMECLLVDEAQFLQPAQVDQLARIVDELSVPVICYGLRLDYTGNTFPGSARLLAIADSLEEIKTICSHCSKKATHVLLKIDGKIIRNADQVIIQDNKTEYIPLCRRDWAKCFY